MEIITTIPTYTNDTKTEALYYVSIGFPIIPLCSGRQHIGMNVAHRSKCQSPGKAPLIPQWTTWTGTTSDHIYSWFRDCQYINIGLPLGSQSGLVGIDIDGQQGEVIFNAMSGGIQPKTWEFATGNGKRLLYRLPVGLKTKKMTFTGKGKHEEFSILCDGQQTVLPPSVHATGRIYKWREGFGPKDIPVADAPGWIIEQIRQEENYTSPPITAESWLTKLQEGNRNEELTKRAGSLIGRGVPKDLAFKTLLTFNNESCEPPLPESEVATIIESISLREAQRQAKESRLGERQPDKATFKPTPFARLFMSQQASIGFIWKYSSEMGSFFRCDDTIGPWERMDIDFVKSEVRKIMINENHGGNKKWDGIHYVNEGMEAIKSELVLPGEKNIFDLGYCVFNKRLKYNPMEIVCLENGILDWLDLKVSPWTHEVYTTIKLPVSYYPDAKCPYWEKALHEWIPDEATIMFLQEFVGLLLIPDTSFRTAVFLFGTGANGKSMFLDTIHSLFGDALVSIPLHRLTDRFETAYLQNKLVNICGDIDAKYIADTGVIKTIIGGDINGLRGEFKHGKSFDFTPVCRLMFSANALPKVADKSIGWYTRWKFVEFPHTFPVNPAYKIEHTRVFESEKSGILNWALAGLQRLKMANQWTSSSIMKQSEDDYRAENDNVSAFIADFVEKTQHMDSSTVVSSPALYRCYTEWVEKFMTGTNNVSQNEFTRRIHTMGFEKAIRKVEGRSSLTFLGMKVKPMYSNTYTYWAKFKNMEENY